MTVAVVAGAAGGIGRAVAERLATEGHRVAGLDLDPGKIPGACSLSLACDVRQRDGVESALSEVERQAGPVGVLVHCAGVGGPFHTVDEVSDEEWDWVMNTNLRSVFLLARRVLPTMKRAAFGRVVHIASVQGLLGSARSSTYVASKHGMVGYTRALAAEWGPFGITCNAICPGFVETAMGVPSDAPPGYRDGILAKSPTRRMSTPGEIAGLVAYLVGPDGGSVNGAALTVDGGLSAHVGVL